MGDFHIKLGRNDVGRPPGSQRPAARRHRRGHLSWSGRPLPFNGGVPFGLRHVPAL